MSARPMRAAKCSGCQYPMFTVRSLGLSASMSRTVAASPSLAAVRMRHVSPSSPGGRAIASSTKRPSRDGRFALTSSADIADILSLSLRRAARSRLSTVLAGSSRNVAICRYEYSSKWNRTSRIRSASGSDLNDWRTSNDCCCASTAVNASG